MPIKNGSGSYDIHVTTYEIESETLSIVILESSIQWWISGLEIRAVLRGEGSIPLLSANDLNCNSNCFSHNTIND